MKKRARKTVHRYQGYFMRSYAETRWAGIMDALEVRWLYEVTPVKTRYGMYLPDFILPLSGVAVEVKGPKPTAREVHKAQDASLYLKMPVVIVFGDPVVRGVSITGGYVMAVYGRARVSFALSELADLVLWNTAGDTWSRLMKACIKQKYNPVRRAGETLDELFIGDSDERIMKDLINSNEFRREAVVYENSCRLREKSNQILIESGLSKFSSTVVTHTHKLMKLHGCTLGDE